MHQQLQPCIINFGEVHFEPFYYPVNHPHSIKSMSYLQESLAQCMFPWWKTVESEKYV